MLALFIASGTSAGAQQPGVPAPGGPTETEAQRQLAEAEARYRASIALQPTVAAYHHSLGIILERQGRTAEAMQAYAEALRLDSIPARHHAAYGRLLLQSGDEAGGTLHLRGAITRDSEDATTRVLLAGVLVKNHDFDAAVPLLREALRVQPEDAQAAGLLAEAEAQSASVQEGYHDLSDFEDEAAPSIALVAAEILFGSLLVIAGAILLLPILSTLFLLLVQAPIAWARGTLS